MKITMINGSPKPSKSNSGWFLERLEEQFTGTHEIAHFNPGKNPATDFQSVLAADVVVFAFPLYVDAMPAHVLKLMADMEQHLHHLPQKDIHVYAIVNNGFYEGKQNHIALDIIKNWCLRTGLRYGQGIGQGAGELIGFMDNVPLGAGPLKNLGKALQTLAQNVEAGTGGDDILFNPNFPRVIYHLAATYSFWHKKARKNGLKVREIKKRL